MSASLAVSGSGTLVRRWNGSSYDNIAEVFSVSGPSKTRGFIKVTNFDSDSGYDEFISGLRDAGTIVLNCNFVRETYDLMNDDYEDDDLQDYEIVLPDPENTSLELSGFVTDLPIEIPVDDRITTNVTIKISGKVEVESGSGS